jgi:Abortive infection C-terminus
LVKKIFATHPKFQTLVRGGGTGNIAKSLASISNALNPIRNRGSLAHPNESLLDEPEAMLVINAVKTLMTYLEARVSN